MPSRDVDEPPFEPSLTGQPLGLSITASILLVIKIFNGSPEKSTIWLHSLPLCVLSLNSLHFLAQ